MSEIIPTILAGGLGAVARFWIDIRLKSASTRFPTGIIVVNLIGSFFLGLISGFAAIGAISPSLYAVLGIGFCGGFTTFSTAAVDAAKLAAAREWRLFVLQWLAAFAACVLLAGAGYWLAVLI